MCLLKIEAQIDLPYLMINFMANSTLSETYDNATKIHTLFYGMFLTRVFCYFGVNLDWMEGDQGF